MGAADSTCAHAAPVASKQRSTAKRCRKRKKRATCDKMARLQLSPASAGSDCSSSASSPPRKAAPRAAGKKQAARSQSKPASDFNWRMRPAQTARACEEVFKLKPPNGARPAPDPDMCHEVLLEADMALPLRHTTPWTDFPLRNGCIVRGAPPAGLQTPSPGLLAAVRECIGPEPAPAWRNYASTYSGTFGALLAAGAPLETREWIAACRPDAAAASRPAAASVRCVSGVFVVEDVDAADVLLVLQIDYNNLIHVPLGERDFVLSTSMRRQRQIEGVRAYNNAGDNTWAPARHTLSAFVSVLDAAVVVSGGESVHLVCYLDQRLASALSRLRLDEPSSMIERSSLVGMHDTTALCGSDESIRAVLIENAVS